MLRWICVLGLFAACGGDKANEKGGLGGEVYELTFGPEPVGPGVETTKCVVLDLGNEQTIRVQRVENRLEATSHHFIVYKVSDQDAQTTPFDCFPFASTINPDDGAPLVVTQKKAEDLQLPPGVAFTLEPHQRIRLELHYINASEDMGTAEATATFVTLAEEDFTDEADFLFIGDVDISIPPRSAGTLGPTYFPLPGDLEGVNFFGITGHEHQWGTDVRVSVTTERENGEDTPVYEVENFQWDEPETVFHDPPFQVPPGGGFRFSCDWMNLSDETVGFGESANQEMCFFWAYYYPSKGARVCFQTDELGGHELCCPGNILCSFLEDQL